METRDWNDVSAMNIYRKLSRTTECCTICYVCAMYFIGEFNDWVYGTALDGVLVLIAGFSMGFLGLKVGEEFRKDTVSHFARLFEAAISVPALWVVLAYVIAIYKGQLSFIDMRLPYLDMFLWPWLCLIFGMSFLWGRTEESMVEVFRSTIGLTSHRR